MRKIIKIKQKNCRKIERCVLLVTIIRDIILSLTLKAAKKSQRP